MARAESAFAHKDSTGILAVLHKDCIKTLDKGALAKPDGGMSVRQEMHSDMLTGARPKAIGPRLLMRYGMSGLFVAAVAVFGSAAAGWLPATGLPLLFLFAVLASAATFGFGPGIAAAGLAFATYNFLFVEPFYTLRVASPADVLALALFMVTAGLTGWLAGKARDDADAANRRAAHLAELSRFTAALADCGTQDSVLAALARHVSNITSDAVLVMTGTSGKMTPVVAIPADLQLDSHSLQACEKAFRHGSSQAATAAGWQGSPFGFFPLASDGKVAAVAGIKLPETARQRGTEIEQTALTMLSQAAAALARVLQAEKATSARVRAEQESLRSTLLLSLSHDLRTPLAAILGSVSSLRQLGASLPEAARDDLLLAAEEETRRLSRYVDDLLTMTRLNTGLKPQMNWVDPADVVHGAVARARAAHPGHSFSPFAGETGKLVRSDAALLEQALFNLLENAAKFSPPGSEITARLALDKDKMCFEIEDNGPGIPPDQHERIFDPLFRGADSSTSGTGLGLAIVRGIATLLDGTVSVKSPLNAAGGTCFTFSLPMENVEPT